MFSLQDLQRQLSSLFGGGSNDVGANGMTYPTPENTSMNWSPGGTPGSSGFGMNLGTAGLALGGLNSLSSLIQGNKAFKLAEDQFKFQKGLANTNLNNSIKSYNTALEDRLTARGKMQGDDAATTQAQIDKNKLSR